MVKPIEPSKLEELLKQASPEELIEWVGVLCERHPDIREALLKSLSKLDENT